MALKVYINGEFYTKEEAKISVFDHGFLYGDGVFEGIRLYNNRIFKLKEHLRRLFASAKSISLNPGVTEEQLTQAIKETIRINNLSDGYARVIITRGIGNLGLDPNICEKPNIIIIADQLDLYPPELYQTGLEVVTVSIRRNLPEALNPAIKSLNYLNNILAKIEVNAKAVHEGIMLNWQGFVTEATGDNIFIVKDNKLFTPAKHCGILVGITRNATIELAAKLNIEVIEENLTQHDIYNADECFLTGTAAELIPVVKVDGRTIGDGKPGHITTKLMEEFRKLTLTEGVPVT